MVRSSLVLAVILLGILLQGTRTAAANEVSDYHRASAVIDMLERSGTRLGSAASDGLASPSRGSGEVYAQVVVTEGSLEFFISHASKLIKGDVDADLQQLGRMLEELKALKKAKADLLGQNGYEAQTQAFSGAFSVGEGVVETAGHLNASLGCLVCDTSP